MITTFPIYAALAALSVQDGAWTQARLESVAGEIQAQVEVLRGARFTRAVKVKLSDTAGLRDYLRQREAAMVSPARLHRDECAAKLLGLVAPGYDLRSIENEVIEGQVGGFYDPPSKTFFLMDAMKGSVAKVVLAHELTHALDDQLHGLDAALRSAHDDTDAELAIRSVIEGSGTNLMNRWMKAHSSELTLSELQSLQEMGADALAKAPPLVWKPLVASYYAGDGFLSRAGGLNLTAKAAPPADVDAAFRAPPRSTEQVLHPERYWDAEKRDEPVRLAFDAASQPAGWTELAQDTLGEMTLALVTTPVADRKGLDMSNPMSLLGLKFTNEGAKGWGGDRLILLGRGEERFLQLATVWDSARDADEFAEALSGVAPKPFTAAREASAGWVPRFTPTHFDVRRGATADGRASVVVRSASLAAADPAAFAGLDVAWSVRPAAASAEDRR